MLTNKGKYGLKALVHLAGHERGELLSVIDISEAENIPKKFLDTILLELRNAGFVRSKKGPGGGYCLAKEPKDIAIGAVVRTLDGPLAPIACASRTAYQPCDDCHDLAGCAVRLAMLEVRDAMANVLDTMSLADMVARSVEARDLVI